MSFQERRINTSHSMTVNASTLPLDQLMDIKKLIQPILRFKWRILTFALLVTAITIFVVLSMTPIYSAKSTLLIEAAQAQAIKIDEVYGINSGQDEYYGTQFEILKSRSIAQRVFNELNLENNPVFNQTPTWLSELKSKLNFIPKELISVDSKVAKNIATHQMIDIFIESINIIPVAKTQLVNISYESSDAQLAAEVANAIGDTYIVSQLESKLGMTQKANTWLSGRLEDLRLKLDQSEYRLEQFKVENGLIDVEGVTALDAKELERLSDEITVARSRKAQADSFMAVVKRYGATDISRLESLPEVTSHLSIQNVKREVVLVERKVSELQQVYGPKHPKMIAAQAELSTVQQNLHKQISRLVQGIEDEAQTAAQTLQALETQFGQAKGAFQNLSTKDTDYQRLLREVDTNRQLFDSFLSRQKETEVTGDFDSPVARFTDRAVVPLVPEKPKKKAIIILAFIASLGFAMVMVLILDALNDTIKTSDDVEKLLAQRALGYIPKAKKGTSYDDINFAFYDPNLPLHAEAVRTIRTSMSLMAMGSDLHTIEVTSSNPNEGKTTTSMNLAFAYATMEKVLIIDADLRKSSLGLRFGLPTYQPGLANVLSGTESIEHCIVKEVKHNVDVMPAGAVPLNPQELLASSQFAELLTELKTQYSKIIIDTPPVHAVSDALIITSLCDATVLVVKAAHTRSEAIKLTLAKLNQARSKVFGVVLNQFNTKDAARYQGDYGYYQAYGAEYASKTPAESSKENTKA
ncbi:GumC family protein [Shewanella ulleungensis]|uniref:non-specific protein-tyrosine kinase n=1 Tax=Shewanella ulleungensis TaxID=2282699 RepID=A0ABQ2QQW1_9GAMM|nr:polysaccharide biosynthesis tyrosine autokinase [Shewanella ulleungensis]MCL1151636.1 polysaccharide biosynthesis tyrosine autokinase [Shewanella ulleungensis]GGP90048.1 chain-length determining protein [Shewanella ulleungensis]